MDLDILLWLGGMLFSLAIFAVKVGFGLGFGGMRWKGIFLTLSMYLVLFVLIAGLSERLFNLLKPVLTKGPYLHALMASGMILWGILLLKRHSTGHRTQTKLKFKIQNSKTNNSELSTLNSLLFLLPCPVCLTAMTFSIWSALNVFKWHPVWVGLAVGAVFAVFSLIIYLLIKAIPHSQSSLTQEVRLGLAMIVVGIYFIASLYIPAKIEEAQLAYRAFLSDTQLVDINQQLGMLGLLALFFMVGFFIFRPQGEGK